MCEVCRTEIDNIYSNCPNCRGLSRVISLREYNGIKDREKKEVDKKLQQQKAAAKRLREMKKKKQEEQKNKADTNLNFKD
jgi:predicted ATP-dependent serine protease